MSPQQLTVALFVLTLLQALLASFFGFVVRGFQKADDTHKIEIRQLERRVGDLEVFQAAQTERQESIFRMLKDLRATIDAHHDEIKQKISENYKSINDFYRQYGGLLEDMKRQQRERRQRES